jgi:Cys-tRNA(Pro)/Cys-tRNA(Cys) deacylase
MSTRGIKVLEERGVSFEVVEYLYKQKGAGRAAEAVGWGEEQVVKSLVVTAGRDFWFVLVPAHRDLSLNKLARRLGVKAVEMSTVRDAERLTGYVEGGISPFGSYAALPVVMEQALLEHDRVLINAGHRGVLVAMSPWDLQELLSAEVEDVVA